MALGKTVKKLREARGWTLKDLSKRAGVPVGTIGALEVRDSARSEYAAKLAQGFGVPLEELLPATQSDVNEPLYTYGAKQPPALTGQAQTAINFDDAVRVIADAISASPARGSDVLIGALTSLAKDPDRVMHRQVLASIINAPDQSTAKAA
jgi:transcriptional regulator with XRE-family HTH domain